MTKTLANLTKFLMHQITVCAELDIKWQIVWIQDMPIIKPNVFLANVFYIHCICSLLVCTR